MKALSSVVVVSRSASDRHSDEPGGVERFRCDDMSLLERRWADVNGWPRTEYYGPTADYLIHDVPMGGYDSVDVTDGNASYGGGGVRTGAHDRTRDSCDSGGVNDVSARCGDDDDACEDERCSSPVKG